MHSDAANDSQKPIALAVDNNNPKSVEWAPFVFAFIDWPLQYPLALFDWILRLTNWQLARAK